MPSDFDDNMNFNHFFTFLKLRKYVKIHVIVEIWGIFVFLYGRGQQLTPPQSGHLCRHFQHSKQHLIIVFSHVVYHFQPLKKHQNSCYHRNLSASSFFDMGEVSNWPLPKPDIYGVTSSTLNSIQSSLFTFIFIIFKQGKYVIVIIWLGIIL